MKLKILSKTETRERRGGEIVTRYGCTILRDNAAQGEDPPATVQVMLIGDTIGDKGIDDIIEIA